MAHSIKLGKHFVALTEKYGKKAVITKTFGGHFTLSFIPQDPDLQHQLNQIRNSGQVRSDNWRGIEEGRLLMDVVGVLPVDELIAALKADMEELGYEVEVLPKAEGVRYKGQGSGLMAWDVTPEELVELQGTTPLDEVNTTLGDVFREAQQKVNQEQQPLVYPPTPQSQEELDELLNIQPTDNIYDIGEP